MSELHIRVNKRSVERTLCIIIILVLAVLLFLRWDAPGVDQEVVTNLEQQNEALNNQVANLTEHVSTLQEELETTEKALEEAETVEQEPEETQETQQEPEETEEPQLSGDIEVTWSITMDGDRFERATVVLDNGRDRAEDLSYNLYWKGFFPDTVNDRGTVYLASGARKTLVLESGGDGISPQGDQYTDTLVLRITDNDQNLIDELQEVVR